MSDVEENDRESIIEMKRNMEARASAEVAQRRAKRRKTNHANPSDFAAALSKVLGPLPSTAPTQDSDSNSDGGSSGGENAMEESALSRLESKVSSKERKQATMEKAKAKERAAKMRVIEKYHILPKDEPNYADEKGLRRIATAAVVKLFNAVRKAQQVVAQRDLASLSYTAQQAAERDANRVFSTAVASSTASKGEWDVLHDDFVHAKAKQRVSSTVPSSKHSSKGGSKRHGASVPRVSLESRTHTHDDSD